MEKTRCTCTRPFAEGADRPLDGEERLLVDRLIASMDFPDDRVDEVVLGPKQIVVRTGDRAALATTLGSSSQKELSRAESVQGATLREVASLLYDDRLLNRSLAAAALNASLLPPAAAESPNALDLILERGRGKDVAVVGDFPFTGRIRQEARLLYLLELQDVPHRLEREKWDEALAACQVAAITGTALLTRSLARYLKGSPQAYRILLGATVPLSPVLLDPYGVDVLAGSVVVDIEATCRGVRSGLSIAQLHRSRCLRFCNRSRARGSDGGEKVAQPALPDR